MDSYNWTSVAITAADPHSVTITYKPCGQKYVMGWRYLWRETPCQYKSCPVYSVENDLPAPPFIYQGPISDKTEVCIIKHSILTN